MSFLSFLLRRFSSVLRKSSESAHLCLVLGLKGIMFSLSSLYVIWIFFYHVTVLDFAK